MIFTIRIGCDTERPLNDPYQRQIAVIVRSLFIHAQVDRSPVSKEADYDWSPHAHSGLLLSFMYVLWCQRDHQGSTLIYGFIFT